jgi:hypothetical protein
MSAKVDAAKEALAAEPPAKSHAAQLVALAAQIELFHDRKQVAYGAVVIDDHRETWRLRSASFKGWLAHGFHVKHGKVASDGAVSAALNALEGRALLEGPERDVHVRIAEHDGKVYLDLGGASWTAVEIDGDGWRLVTDPPVYFRRPPGLAALPVPAVGGDIADLAGFMNVSGDWRLIATVFLAALRPVGPFPPLWSIGEHGSAKSTLGKLLRALVDPRSAGGLRAPPRDTRDLAVAAEHSWVLAYDNLSHVPEWLSDALCRLSTGGGFAVRQLYTDEGEMLFEALRPIVINGITDIITRPDLLDRAVMADHPAIPEDKRRSEAEFWSAFEAKRPEILGVLLGAVSTGLRNLADVVLPEPPRMADFARWGVAVAPALGWTGEEFLAEYAKNRRGAVITALEASPIAWHVRVLAARGFKGNSQKLREDIVRLAHVAGESTLRTAGFPQNARAMRSALDRITANLRAVGVLVTPPAKTDGTRTIRITMADGAEPMPEPDPIPSAGVANTNSTGRIPYDKLGVSGWDEVPVRGYASGTCSQCGRRESFIRGSQHFGERAVCQGCHNTAGKAASA